MKNKIIYTSMIATVSVLLISVMVFQAEAKTFEKDQEYGLKGSGMDIFGSDENGNKIQLQIYPLENNKDVFVDYRVRTATDFSLGQCFAPKQILKVSGTNKASAEFNTADLNCSVQHIGLDGIITATVEGTSGTTVNDKYDNKICDTYNGVEYCTRDRGSLTTFLGTGTISGFGLSFDNQDAAIKDVKLRHTAWTSP